MSALSSRLEGQTVLAPARSRIGKGVLIAVAVCGATGALALFRLGAKSLWHDEAFSDAVVRLPLSSMWQVITRGDFFNGLYYGILHFWQWGGESEVWLRMPSVAFGVMAALSLFALNRRLFGVRTAVIASILLAINTYFVEYEQEARPYSLAIFLVVLATYLFVVALDDPSTWRWIAYGVVCALAMYAHLFAAFVVGAHLASLALRRHQLHLRRLAAAYGVTALLVVPLLAVMLWTDARQRYFIPTPNLGSFQWLFLNFTGAGGVATREGNLLLLAYFLVCLSAVFFTGKAALRQRKGHRAGETWPHALMLLWLSVPIVLSFVVSMVVPIFLPRYLIVALPALVTVGAIGISSLPRRSFGALALIAMIGLSILPLRSYYRAGFKEGQDWRNATAYVVQSVQPGDGAVFLSRYGRRPFEYYLDRFGGKADLRPLYPGVDWGGYTPVLADLNIESTRTVAGRIRNGPERVWVILVWRGFATVNEDARPVIAALHDDFREVTARRFGPTLRVVLYERNSA